MWILFTRALTAGSSTTRVSILNTSANFVVTALLGMLVFAEALPLLWWVGAALLVAGSVIIGAREGGQETASGERAIALAQEEPFVGDAVAVGLGAGGVVEDLAVEGRYRDEEVDGVIEGPGHGTSGAGSSRDSKPEA